MKQLYRISLLLLALLLPVTAVAYDFEVDGIYYDINGNEATVTYQYYDEDDDAYTNDYSGDVIIPATVAYNGATYTVTSISSGAFAGSSDLTSVTIPNTVTSIGVYMFRGCNDLVGLTVAGGNTTYDSRGNCNAIIETSTNTLLYGCKNTVIPNSVTTIGSNAFWGRTGLTSMEIPNSVTTIGTWAFAECPDLTSVTIPNSVTTIDAHAFRDCSSLASIEIPNSVTSIGAHAFYGTAWYNNQPDGLVYIGLVAYKYKGAMPEGAHINIADGTRGIASYAFQSCSRMAGVTIPYTVVTIGSGAFATCLGLTSLEIPNSVITIESSAFQSCTGLTEVEIPNSVTTIGGGAFSSCSGLTSVTIGNSVTTIGNDAFAYCYSLANVAIGSSVTHIGTFAFSHCGELTSLEIPNSVTTIDKDAFSYCTALTSVTIPSSVTTIGKYVFTSCYNLTSMTVASGNTTFDSRDNCNAIIETSSNTLLYGCKNTVIPNTVTAIGDGAFDYCTGLTSMEIPNSVTSIGINAFAYCSGLTSVTIGNSVKTIGNFAFTQCTGLTSVEIPNSVTTIDLGAFSSCSALKNLTIGNSVNSIGLSAFRYCNRLTDVYSYILDPSSVATASYVFASNQSSYSGRTLHVPAGTTSAYQSNGNWYPYFGQIVEMPLVTASSITLNKAESVMPKDATFQLVAAVLPESTTNMALTWASSDTTIATVDENGLVTAVAVGNATITATTTDGSNLSASCAVTVSDDLYDYDNYLAISDTTVMPGETVVIPVRMINDASIISIQTDIILPEGLELLQEDGEYLIDPSPRMTGAYSIMGNAVSNDTIRVICRATIYEPFAGQSGDDLFYITVKVADDAEGDYTVRLKNTQLTNSDFVDLMAPEVAANVKAYTLGDINGDGNVTVGDVTDLIDYLLFGNASDINLSSADCNHDNKVNISDVTDLIDYLLMGSWN